MVRGVVVLAAFFYFGFKRCVGPDIMAIEIHERDQAIGVLIGMKRCTRRVTIGVYNVSVKCRTHSGGVRQYAIIERVNVPVGVIQPATAIILIR